MGARQVTEIRSRTAEVQQIKYGCCIRALGSSVFCRNKFLQIKDLCNTPDTFRLAMLQKDSVTASRVLRSSLFHPDLYFSVTHSQCVPCDCNEEGPTSTQCENDRQCVCQSGVRGKCQLHALSQRVA